MGGLVVEIADAVDVVGGNAAVTVLLAQVVRTVHRKLSDRQGCAATISLGAAEYLALADLVDRVPQDSPTPRVSASGDVNRYPHDTPFIGGDAYCGVSLGR